MAAWAVGAGQDELRRNAVIDLDPVLRFEAGSFGLTVATHEGWLLDVTVGEALT